MAKYATGNTKKQYQIDLVWSFHTKKWLENGNGNLYMCQSLNQSKPQLEPKPMNGDSISETCKTRKNRTSCCCYVR